MTRTWPVALVPLGLLALLVGAFLVLRPLDRLTSHVPPIETLVVERTALGPDGISVWVRAGGSAPLSIAQVQVDGAYWQFEQTPPRPLSRLEAARLDLPYPWVEGGTHHLVFVTSTGVSFEHTIDVALPTPVPSASDLSAYGLVGLVVGVVPVAIGMMFYPVLRGAGRRALEFVLALTVGLLVFLLVDTLQEGLEVAAGAASSLQASAVVWLAALLTFLALMVIGRRGGRTPAGAALAFFIALGIGLHNLGEGLVIGASFATGATALASFLVVGFALHNVTEGVGIAVPLVETRPRLWVFAALAALAGLPAVLGTWAGAFAFSPHWAALCFGIGAGAILQVVVEVAAYLHRRATGAGASALSGTTLAGFASGLAIGGGSVAAYLGDLPGPVLEHAYVLLASKNSPGLTSRFRSSTATKSSKRFVTNYSIRTSASGTLTTQLCRVAVGSRSIGSAARHRPSVKKFAGAPIPVDHPARCGILQVSVRALSTMASTTAAPSSRVGYGAGPSPVLGGGPSTIAA